MQDIVLYNRRILPKDVLKDLGNFGIWKIKREKIQDYLYQGVSFLLERRIQGEIRSLLPIEEEIIRDLYLSRLERALESGLIEEYKLVPLGALCDRRPSLDVEVDAMYAIVIRPRSLFPSFVSEEYAIIVVIERKFTAGEGAGHNSAMMKLTRQLARDIAYVNYILYSKKERKRLDEYIGYAIPIGITAIGYSLSIGIDQYWLRIRAIRFRFNDELLYAVAYTDYPQKYVSVDLQKIPINPRGVKKRIKLMLKNPKKEFRNSITNTKKKNPKCSLTGYLYSRIKSKAAK